MLEQKVKELYTMGRSAKKLAREGSKLHMQMANICHQLRPVEFVFKALYPVLSELYDELIKLHDTKKYDTDNTCYLYSNYGVCRCDLQLYFKAHR